MKWHRELAYSARISPIFFIIGESTISPTVMTPLFILQDWSSVKEQNPFCNSPLEVQITLLIAYKSQCLSPQCEHTPNLASLRGVIHFFLHVPNFHGSIMQLFHCGHHFDQVWSETKIPARLYSKDWSSLKDQNPFFNSSPEVQITSITDNGVSK